MARLFLFCFFVCVFSKIVVHSPESLKTEVTTRYPNGAIPSSLANFGNPPYGSKMIGKVYSTKVKGEKTACDPLHPINFEEEGIEALASPILLVDRGKCPFVRKVRHAQDIGAKAVLVIDNESEEENIERFVITDDGSSGDISIPSFLISKEAGKLLRNSAKTDDVSLLITFELGNQTTALDVTLWMTSGHSGTLQFVSEFAEKALAFPQGTIRFHPRYVLWFCEECKKNNFGAVSKDCLSGGRYCAPDPDGNGPLNGQLIVAEDLRQICLYKNSKHEGMGPWFKYVSGMYATCFHKGLTDECSYRVMKEFVNVEKIKTCVNESFEGERRPTRDENKVLKSEKSHWLREGPGFYPALQINNATFKGDFEVQEVMLALCASFTNPPPTCVTVLPMKPAETVSFAKLVLTILGVLGVLTSVLVVYRLWMRKEMRRELKDQVTSAVSEYVSLNTEDRRRSFT